MGGYVPRGAGDERIAEQRRVTINPPVTINPVPKKRGRPVTGKAMTAAERKRLSRAKQAA